jgi:hypothetical protein
LGTFGSVTLGMITTLSADGASFLGALVSPPGWYWYLPSPPSSCQGLLLGAWATDRSEEALVGERAAKVSDVRGQGARPRCVDAWELLQKCHPATPKMPLMMTRRTCGCGLATARPSGDAASAAAWCDAEASLHAALAQAIGACTQLLPAGEAGAGVFDVRRAQGPSWRRP